MANIISDEETEVMDSEPEPSYDDLQKAYNELLDDSQMVSSHYFSLKNSFQKLFIEFENLMTKKEKLKHEKYTLLKEKSLL